MTSGKLKEGKARTYLRIYFDNAKTNKAYDLVAGMRLLLQSEPDFKMAFSGLYLMFLIRGHTLMSCDRGHAEIERLLTQLGYPVSTIAEYLDWLTKTDLGSVVWCDKSIRPSGYKMTKRTEIAGARQIWFDSESAEVPVKYSLSHDPVNLNWKSWSYESDGKLVIAQSKKKIDKALKSFNTWTKFVSPRYHETLKIEHTGIVNFTESTLKTLILPSSSTQTLPTVDFTEDFDDARTDDELPDDDVDVEVPTKTVAKKKFTSESEESDEETQLGNDAVTELEHESVTVDSDPEKHTHETVAVKVLEKAPD